MNSQGQIFYVVSKKDLISSKRASGREVDLEDIISSEMIISFFFKNLPSKIRIKLNS